MTVLNAKETIEIEVTIETLEEAVKTRDALSMLEDNAQFNEVISKKYFEQEAIRLVHLKSDSNMQTEKNQAGVIKQMDAIGGLSEYFRSVYARGSIAEKQLEQYTEELNGGTD